MNRFMWLHRNFNYSSKVLSILTKVAVQQVFFAPVIITYFFSAQALFAGESLEDTWERLKMTFPKSIVNSAKLWPLVTVVNFTVIPVEYRSIFAGAIAVGWQTYLSFLNRQAEIEENRLKALASAEKVKEVSAEGLKNRIEA